MQDCNTDGLQHARRVCQRAETSLSVRFVRYSWGARSDDVADVRRLVTLESCWSAVDDDDESIRQVGDWGTLKNHDSGTGE